MATQKSGDFKTQLRDGTYIYHNLLRVSKTRISEPSTEVPGCAVLNVLTGTFCWWINLLVSLKTNLVSARMEVSIKIVFF